MADIEKLELYDKLYLELLSFRMPKLKSVDFTGEIKNYILVQKLSAIRVDSLSVIDDELDEVIAE